MDAPPPPPPPPPHGASAHGGKAGGLPEGKYDIFVIPPSSAGSGFLYLPSLHTHRNSFLAGSACTALVFFIWSVVVPVIREWFYSVTTGGGSGFLMLIIVVGVGCWAWGKTQAESSGGSNTAGSGGSTGGTAGGTFGATHPNGSAHANTTGAGPKSSWQRSNAGAGGGAKTSWEKAREETRKKEEDRRRTEEAKKRREDAEKERQRQRDKDAREREERERKEKRDKAEKEKTASEGAAKEKASPPKRPPGPTARTETEDDAYSFRPYDRPKKPVHKANSAASMYSESSYAASQTTARTTPPPMQRGPYATKDPDKIIIKGVYSFNNTFMRTPIAQLISNAGSVTDGLILRITTEGLFIDDDVRGVPQREWDVKAWTMKLAEVWCPHLAEHSSSFAHPRTCAFPLRSRSASSSPLYASGESEVYLKQLHEACDSFCRVSPTEKSSDTTSASSRRTFTSTTSSSSFSTASHSSIGTDETLTQQSGEMHGLHVLRACIRDQEGKKYVFVLSQSEGWKVAMGLQRLRRGTQVRALGVSGLPQNETKALLENLGYV